MDLKTCIQMILSEEEYASISNYKRSWSPFRILKNKDINDKNV